jgi:hypothetical protein
MLAYRRHPAPSASAYRAYRPTVTACTDTVTLREAYWMRVSARKYHRQAVSVKARLRRARATQNSRQCGTTMPTASASPPCDAMQRAV